MALMSLIDKKTNRQSSPASPRGGKATASEADENFLSATTAYFKGVRAEWDKVTWPNRMQLWQQAIVVLVMVVITAVGIYSMDWVFRFVIGLVTPH